MTAEPLMCVNGQALTSSQASVVRVAVTLYHGEVLKPRFFGSSVESERMRDQYMADLTEVLGFMWAMESGGTNE